jgi:hypothetical protein
MIKKEGKMKDKKFAVALGIIVLLAIVLLYVLVVSPRLQGYVVNKQVDAQKILIKSMMDAANQQGYITLNDGETEVVLINQKVLEQQAAQQAEGQQETPQ